MFGELMVTCRKYISIGTTPPEPFLGSGIPNEKTLINVTMASWGRPNISNNRKHMERYVQFQMLKRSSVLKKTHTPEACKIFVRCLGKNRYTSVDSHRLQDF